MFFSSDQWFNIEFNHSFTIIRIILVLIKYASYIHDTKIYSKIYFCYETIDKK